MCYEARAMIPPRNALALVAFALACSAALGCAADAAATSTDAGASAPSSSGQGVCDARAEGLCIAYPGDTAAQKSICLKGTSASYAAPSVCLPASRVGTCACNDVGQGLGAATLSLYAPVFTCASAKQACTTACNGHAGTFNGGC